MTSIKDSRNIWVYDVEVYPNLFTVTFLSLLDPSHYYQFVVNENEDDREEIKHFLNRKDLILAGYNSLGYDNIIVAYLLSSKKPQKPLVFCKSLYNLSQAIIGGGFNNPKVRKLRYENLPFKSIDVFKIKPSGKDSVSLKQLGINLKWYKVQDLPLPFDENVSLDQVDLILQYNLNDCQITSKAFHYLKPKILLREDISNLYGVNVINETESGIGSRILNKLYSDRTGKSLDEFKELRTTYDEIKVSDCIQPVINFQTTLLQNFLADLKSLTLKAENEFKYKRVLKFGGNIYDLGVGGIHTRDASGEFNSDDKWIIRDADVTSFYPYIIENYRIKPAHLEPVFNDIQEDITADRVKYKSLYEETEENDAKTRAEVLKITANAIFGKLKDKFYWLYDPKAFMSVTLNGQMLLLMLAERFFLADIQVVSANTDGIVCRIRKDQDEAYRAICKQWMEDTNFELKFVDYRQYVRRDVNNYFTVFVKKDGKLDIKEKGIFEREINIFKGYSPKIIPKALINFFAFDIPIEDTVRACTDIFEFMYSQKTGSEFKSVVTSIDKELNRTDTVLQKNNRFYVAKSGGALNKVKGGKKTGILVGETIRIANDIGDEPFSFYDVDFDYYIKEARDIVSEIRPRGLQMSLFDLMAV